MFCLAIRVIGLNTVISWPALTYFTNRPLISRNVADVYVQRPAVGEVKDRLSAERKLEVVLSMG